MSKEVAKAIVLERVQRGPYSSLRDLFERVRLDRDVLEALDRAGAFARLTDRRKGLYQAGVLVHTAQAGQRGLFDEAVKAPPFPDLKTMEQLSWDFGLKGYSEHAVHPVDLYRNQLLELGATPMEQLRRVTGHIRTAGLVVARQKPPTAKGFAFWLLEDNTERAQVVIHPELWERHRETLRDGRILVAEGMLQRQGQAWTVRASGVVQVV